MVDLRDVVIFLAGAQTFHTLSHLWLRFSGALPLRLRLPPMTFTVGWNDGAIVINALVTGPVVLVGVATVRQPCQSGTLRFDKSGPACLDPRPSGSRWPCCWRWWR